MGALYLVRHGQASFGTDDYDRLTDTGVEQSRHLGDYFAARRIRIDAVMMGSLTRHRQTAEAFSGALRNSAPELLDEAAPEVFTALNEYDPDAVIKAHTGEHLDIDPAAEARDPSVVRQHFRLLREALLAWASAATSPRGMPSFADFQSHAVAVVADARARFAHGSVVLMTSGGPIGAIVAAALSAPPSTGIELNLRIRNASVTEFATNAHRHHLVSFNGVAHLDAVPHLVTYT